MMKEMIDSDDMRLINKLRSKSRALLLKADDVYTFSVVLCDNDVDRDNEHFSDSALDTLAKMFIGVTGIYDHDPSAKNQVARIYDCKTEFVDGKTTVYGTPYKRVTAKAYIPACKSSEELIAMLDSGIKKEVSVGCGIAKCTCSICGEDMRIGACGHRKGKRYDGRLCCGVLDEPIDVYEWAFVFKNQNESEDKDRTTKKTKRANNLSYDDMISIQGAIADVLYEELQWVYCDSCRWCNEDGNKCEECHRKSMKWSMSNETSQYLAKRVISKIKRG